MRIDFGAGTVPLSWALLLFAGGGCVDAGGTGVERLQPSPLVYGADGRVEIFDVADPRGSLLPSQSIVALVPGSSLRSTGSSVAVEAPSWSDADDVCPEERFADQPSAAFCTGVLVDWDLVLTAGHCVRLLALDDFAVVFGYYYSAPGVLDLGADVRRPVEIVAEALDLDGADPRLDYAWLRLDRPVSPPRSPAPVYAHGSPLQLGSALVSIGAGGGLPLKYDAGGRVRDLRSASSDYFVADTDTTGGSSGGGAFDDQFVLTGVLARGGADLVPTERGCRRLVHAADGAVADEQFTYAFRAVEGLCAKHPEASTLCRPSCGEPCLALPLPPPSDEGGCSLAGRSRANGEPSLLCVCFVVVGFVGFAAARRRSRSQKNAHRSPRDASLDRKKRADRK